MPENRAHGHQDGAELTGSEKYVVDGVTYTVHPAAALFPLVSGAAYEEGVASVRENGVLHPIRHVSRQIVDGRNRLRWAIEVGADIPMEPLDPSVDIYAFVAAQNMHRRHLNAAQKATIAHGLRELAAEFFRDQKRAREAARNAAARRNNESSPEDADGNGADGNGAGGDGAPPDAAKATGEPDSADVPVPEAKLLSPEAAANMADCSPSSVKRVGGALRRAPELQPFLRDGKISITQAKALSRATPEQRQRVLESVTSGRAPDFAEAFKRHGIPYDPATGKVEAPKAPRGAKPNAKSAGPKPDASGDSLPALPSVGGSSSAAAPAAPSPAADAAGGDSASRPADPPAPAAPSTPAPSPAEASPPAPAQPVDEPPAPADSAPAASAGAEASPASPAAAPAPSGPVEPPAAPVIEYEPIAPAEAEIADYPPDLLSPETVITAVTEIYGRIHLDPCSMDLGQDRVRAKGWYGADQDGLTERWQGPVHVFPPGKLCRKFAAKLRAELDRDLEQATFLANFDLAERWVGDFLDHRHFSGVVVSRKLVEFDQAGSPRRFRAPQLVALYLFGAPATPEQLARAFGFWGRVLVNARET